MNGEKRPNLFMRSLAFLLTAALVLGAVFLVANWQKLNFDSIKRWFMYLSLQRNEMGQVDSFPYEGGLESSVARVGDDLLVCSSAGIRLYAPNGSAYVEQACRLEHPVCRAVGNTALVYDAGGVDLFVYRDREPVFTYAAEEGHTLLSASLSAQGLLSVVTQGTGHRSTAMAYQADFQALMSVTLSAQFITDAVLSPDGRTLVLATAGQANGSYDSQLCFYALSRGEGDAPDAVCSLGSGTVLQLNWTERRLRVLQENALTMVESDGTVAGRYPFQDRFLKGFSLDANDCSALLLSKYRAGAASELVLVDTAGEQTASLSVGDQILSLSAAGRYISLLTANVLSIYTDQMVLYHTLEGVQGARKVLQREDGSVTLIAEESARLYLPN